MLITIIKSLKNVDIANKIKWIYSVMWEKNEVDILFNLSPNMFLLHKKMSGEEILK